MNNAANLQNVIDFQAQLAALIMEHDLKFRAASSPPALGSVTLLVTLAGVLGTAAKCGDVPIDMLFESARTSYESGMTGAEAAMLRQ